MKKENSTIDSRTGAFRLFYWVSVLILFVSCRNEADNPISLHYVENNSLQLYYPLTDEPAVISILGGDGEYAVACSDESVLEAKIVQEQKTLVLTPLALGEATVTISDGASNVYMLNVNISYYESHVTVKRIEVRIKGGNITEEEKRAIEEKAISTVPVKVNGGYRLIRTGEDGLSGKVIVYAETFGENGVEGVYEAQTDADGFENSHNKIIMQLNGRERIFYITAYDLSTRSGGGDVISSRWAFA